MNAENDQLDEVLFENTREINPERIGFGRRLGAYLLDALISITIGSIVGILFGDKLVDLLLRRQLEEMEQVYGGLGEQFLSIMEPTLQVLSGIYILWLLPFLMEGLIGQSPGKMILGIRNTLEDGTKAGPTFLWSRSLIKYSGSLLYLVSSLLGSKVLESVANTIGMVILVAFFFVLRESKQALYDQLTKTVVSRSIG